METQKLMTLAIDAGINLKNDDCLDDCIPVWIDHMCVIPGEFMDFLPDAVADIFTEKEVKGGFQLPNRKGRLEVNILMAVDSLKTMENKFYSKAIDASTANSFAFRAGQIGEEVLMLLRERIERHVEENGEEWLADVWSYMGDMEEAQLDDRADAAYEDRRDRALDRQ